MEEKLNNESEQKNVDSNIDYIEAIKEMKEKTVAKEEYDKLKEEHKRLLNDYVNGVKPEEVPAEEKTDVKELRNKLFNDELNNLEYIDNALKLRSELIKQGEKDPFLPWGKNILPTDEDIEKAEKVAQVLQDCVDIADGNSDVFTNELQRRLVDPVLPRKQTRR